MLFLKQCSCASSGSTALPARILQLGKEMAGLTIGRDTISKPSKKDMQDSRVYPNSCLTLERA
jgi:hypothetical protein